MATTHIARSSDASRAINYAEKRAVLKDGYNVDIAYAKSEFKQVRAIYGNKGTTEAYVSRLSFSPKELDAKSETDQKKILELAKEIYAKTYPNQQVALYVHNDTESLHVHAVIGSINLKTGKKLDMNWEAYHGRAQDESKSTWKDQIRTVVDQAMSQAHIIDFKVLKSKLEELAVSAVERGKELTYGLIGTNYKARGSKLGDDYRKETIFNELDRRKNLERQSHGFVWLSERGSQITEEQRARQAAEARPNRDIRKAP